MTQTRKCDDFRFDGKSQHRLRKGCSRCHLTSDQMNGVIDFATLSTEHKGKPDASQRTNVEFKPAKKMKKRRQLDALVGNGKLPRRKHSGHELLRSNDSDSSEVEEFRVLEGHRLGKR